jgi:insertion element IS1 protein InsB
MCRRTRQIVAFAIGERGKATCLHLWKAIPDTDKHCQTFSDFRTAYEHVFPAETHHGVRKETGETAHMERWNNTLRQRMSCSVRQTLSFSKCDSAHQMFTRLFIVQYNMDHHLLSNHHQKSGGLERIVWR